MTGIGQRVPSPRAYDAVTGGTRFTDDLALPGMLHARLVRSPHAHARIVAIDAAPALAIAGVHAVITGRDLPVRYGIIPWTQDEYPLALDKAAFVGDPVACVAAIDEATAARAAAAVHVTWEVLPHVLDPAAALRPDAPQVNATARHGNVTKSVQLAFGDVDGELARSDVVVAGEYGFHGTTHAALEPHCAIGVWEPQGVLTVTSTTQVAHYLHRELARVLGLPEDRVRVIQPPLGGAFGGKSEPFELEFCVAKLAMLTGRPVKLRYTREEVFYAHRGRHPMQLRVRLGATRDGTLTGCELHTLIDGGAYASFGLVTTYYAGQLVTAPLRLRAFRLDSTRVYTNKPACGPKRGHGSVQPRFAFEVTVDKLAEQLGLDPIELRRRNALAAGERTVNELLVRSIGFRECLDRVEAASEWKRKWRRLPFGRGVGVAGSFYISGTNYPIYPNPMPQSAVQLKVDRSGRVTVYSGASEMGQGVTAMLALVAAEELGVELAAVRVVLGDTDLTPVDLGGYSSRTTMMAGNAGHRGAYRGGTIGASPAYSFTAHVAEVSVDVDTGKVTVEHVWAAHDVGRALNPMLVEGQIEGSVYMGLAEALFEEHAFHASGLHRGPSLLDYRLPTALDTPELSALLVESDDPEGPYGAKEAGEGPLHPSLPAIANAIHDAVGVRLDALPFTPARVLAALATAPPRGQPGPGA
ncbi:MAG: molybdopterin-dependent oxidoreductase, partial [Deltaproteobacteria bacterium]|nr:molybdopterin-dependent oxidoreductase [Kofleriaceae bacterium]